MRRWAIAPTVEALLLILSLGTLTTLFACQGPGPEVPEAPSEAPSAPHEHEYSLTLAPEGFGPLFGVKKDGSFTVRLPRLRAFDREGRLLLDLNAYRTDLPGLLEEVTTERKPLEAGPTMAETLSHVRTAARRPAATSDLSDADFFILTYEAAWCVPCKAQLNDVRAFAAAHPELEIGIVRVEADPEKVEGEASESAR